jgi:hypothetical protein
MRILISVLTTVEVSLKRKQRIEWLVVIALNVVVLLMSAVLILLISLFVAEAGANSKDRG